MIMGESTEYYQALKEERSQRKLDRQARFEKLIRRLNRSHPCFTIEEFAPWHYRITRMNHPAVLDIFPTNFKYHRVDTDKRGWYKDVLSLLRTTFKE